MKTDTARPVRLAAYRPFGWKIETVDLDIDLHPTATRVRSQLTILPDPAGSPHSSLRLDGDGLILKGVWVDGVPSTDHQATPDALILPNPPHRRFVLLIETEINPSANTQLMGLYRSGGNWCTQCEAEGFRRITYFADRPDVLSVYSTRLTADRDEAPVLLGNGNLVASGDLPESNRHFALWHDPYPKPCYLFAMVGGRLAVIRDSFTTASGRQVELGIYVEHGKESRADYAMDALKRCMRWDETAFGREYDLDVFNIVAVSDFNMGAMENKGLNIFNDKYVLALPDTATDADYGHIEAIIAHEYFHNWTGNRITCRDWFQLCLKEGLTVYRDQEFTADQRSRPVKRITDVRTLRSQQFVEDAGPLAHPVRPETYHEINNFYTATVYEKGAEIVRMLHTLLGADTFRSAMDLYFDRYDGTAATVEDFLGCFAEASGRDLSQFALWYAQAGTPELRISHAYDAATQILTLDITQQTAPTPGQPVKQPLLIPVRLGLMTRQGYPLPLRDVQGRPMSDVLEVSHASQRYQFSVAEPAVLSIGRGFSAPVTLHWAHSEDDLLCLASHDSDAFNRWQAIQSLALPLLCRDEGGSFDGLARALELQLERRAEDPAFTALALTLPSESDVAREIGENIDPDAIFSRRRTLRKRLSLALSSSLRAQLDRCSSDAPYSPDAASAGRRALKNTCLDLLVASQQRDMAELALRHYQTATTMTDRLAALSSLCMSTSEDLSQQALEAFYQRHHEDALVMDKWLGLQAAIPEHATLDRVQRLMETPVFSFGNPNRVRALIGTFASGNPVAFNAPDGRGYAFVSDMVLRLNESNPQVAARLLSAFRSWRFLEPGRRPLARTALERIAAHATLSSDVRDIVTRSLS